MKAKLKVKLSDARKFLSAIDPSASSFCFRTFDDNEERKAARKKAGEEDELAGKFSGTLKRCSPKLEGRNRQGAGVFVVINEGGHKKADIERVRAVFIDMDRVGMKLDFSEFPKPHIVIESSPGKRHYYWLVSGVSTKGFAEMQKKLITRFGSDKSVCDLPRVMRLPGFIHCKDADAPFRTRIVKMADDLQPYSADVIREALADEKGKCGALKSSAGSASKAGIIESGTHADVLAVTYHMATLVHKGGMSRESAMRALEAIAKDRYRGRPVPTDEVERALDGAIAKLSNGEMVGAVEPLEGRDRIVYAEGQLRRVVDDVEAALVRSAVPIYQRGSELVHPVTSSADAAHGSYGGRSLQEVSAHWLLDQLDGIAQCGRQKPRVGGEVSWQPMNWPPQVGATLLARKVWPFPELRGVIEVPVLRRDGDVCIESGYDERTKLLVAIPGKWPRLKRSPGRRDAEAALQLLIEPLQTFPFCSEADRSVVLSGMLTAVVRPLLEAAPMHAISAPTAGSGKSMLADMIAILGMGRRNAMLGWGDGNVESEKRLGAALMLGDPILCFDNVERPLGGELLCMVLTEQFVRIRVLGLSKVVTLPMTATMLATGNNLVVSGDAKRRILVAALDAKHERPELRKFKNDPVRDVLDNREELVNACLTIMMAYLREKERPIAPKLGSYNGWSKLVRSALLWLGQADPVGVMERTYENDPERAELRQLMEIWNEFFGSKPMMAADVIRKAEEQPAGSNQHLHDAVNAVATSANGKLSPKKLGTYLAAHMNVRIGKLRFVPDVSKDRTGARRWRLKVEK